MIIFSCNTFAVCTQGSDLQKSRSRELQHLLADDQLDREGLSEKLTKKEIAKIQKKDLERRKRVAEIFAEGCLKSAKDYSAAAIIYQHGDTPDHYYQAYIWGKKSSDLGHVSDMAAIAIDRYLINIGNKQLFGSQMFFKELKPNESCMCVEEVELSFPDSLRKLYSGYSLQEKHDMTAKYYNIKKDCPISLCDGKKLKPTPQGSVPGLW